MNEYMRMADRMYDLDKQIERISTYATELEVKNTKLAKEIAELKEKLEIEQNARGDWFGKAVTKDRRLNEAKEIIKEFMRISTASVEEYEPEFTELIGKAEQFIKELDK